MVWYSHLFQNFPQFIVIHTVKGFGIVKKAEIDVFLELSCFFTDPADVGNLICGSSAFSKTSLRRVKPQTKGLLGFSRTKWQLNQLIQLTFFWCLNKPGTWHIWLLIFIVSQQDKHYIPIFKKEDWSNGLKGRWKMVTVTPYPQMPCFHNSLASHPCTGSSEKRPAIPTHPGRRSPPHPWKS